MTYLPAREPLQAYTQKLLEHRMSLRSDVVALR